MNQFDYMNEVVDNFFGKYCPKPVFSVEQDGDLFHVSSGDNGFTVTYDELEELRFKIDVALQEADNER